MGIIKFWTKDLDLLINVDTKINIWLKRKAKRKYELKLEMLVNNICSN